MTDMRLSQEAIHARYLKCVEEYTALKLEMDSVTRRVRSLQEMCRHNDRDEHDICHDCGLVMD